MGQIRKYTNEMDVENPMTIDSLIEKLETLKNMGSTHIEFNEDIYGSATLEGFYFTEETADETRKRAEQVRMKYIKRGSQP